MPMPTKPLKNVLVLCHANRWRSPLCAAVMENHGGLEIKSAGFKEDGKRAGKPIRDAALELGLNLEEHRSQNITKELYEWADVVIYMDGGNLRRLATLTTEWGFATLPTEKVRGLGEFAEPNVNRIPDPAFIKRGTQEFHDVVCLIREASLGLAKKLIAR